MPTATPAPTITVPCTYAVQAGDTFGSIAEQFCLYSGDLFTVNEALFEDQPADTYQLEIGQEIKLSGCE